MSAMMRLVLAGAAMSAFLVFLVVDHTSRRAAGTEIVLAMEGYDPRDFFLGHYSQVATPLSRLDLTEVAMAEEPEPGDRVYIEVAPAEDGLWRPVAVHLDRPAGGVFVLGRAQRLWAERDLEAVEDPETGRERFERVETGRRWLRVEYNIERIYAPRRDAREMDRLLRERADDEGAPLRLILSISDDGRALIKGVEIDGERHIEQVWSRA